MAKKAILTELTNVFRKKPYSIGFALSGGGIRGLSHVGVIKALEEVGVKPNIISGVSAGAVVGALYADGHSPDEIVKIFEHVAFRKMTKLERPTNGFFTIGAFEKFLGSKLRAKTFEELQIPLRVVSTNLDEGIIKVFSSGNLLDAIVSSCSVPVLFKPKVINGVHYVDGGVLQNFPVQTIREDCERVVGINVSPITTAGYKKTIIGVAMRTYHFMYRANIIHDRDLCDLLIEPKGLANYEMFDTEKGQDIFNIGYQTATKMIQDRFLQNKLSKQ